jgi:hypothetical protein
MQVSRECDVSYLFWKVHEIHHEFAVVKDGGEVRLFDGKLLLLDGRNNRFRERLCILLLDPSLDTLSIYLFGGGIVLLVFVQNDCIRRAFCFATWSVANV